MNHYKLETKTISFRNMTKQTKKRKQKIVTKSSQHPTTTRLHTGTPGGERKPWKQRVTMETNRSPEERTTATRAFHDRRSLAEGPPVKSLRGRLKLLIEQQSLFSLVAVRGRQAIDYIH